jgi:hypothetical protein
MQVEPENVIHQLAVADAAAIAEIVERAQTSDDVTTIVAAALFTPAAKDLMARATALATTTRDRQLVAIAAAHLDGDADRVGDLARDHLADHPDGVLVAWITAASNHTTRTPRGSPMSTSTTSPTGITSPSGQYRDQASRRPWYPWLLTALAFPPAGLIAHAVAGRVDSVWAAVLGGVVAGAGIGAAQWALLRRRGVGLAWVAATAAGLGVGLAAGAALVSYRTDITSLAVMGAVSGLAVGVAQGATLGNAKRMLGWGAATAALWALGWIVTTGWGIDVEEQWVVFGISGALTLAFLQSLIVGAFVPAVAAKAVKA